MTTKPLLPYLKNTLLLIFILIILSPVLWFLSILVQDYFQDRCEEKVAREFKNLDALVTLTNEEYQVLGIDRSLIPTRRYYEVKKCLRERRFW